ncbi:MAG: hypothetical protein AUG44_12965 [Actinobacteria bacterium 13_1_20CM_3_71_11]|nr:MAG: hypothetical protein AUG44_12965 [Actinobacteria bacterium 13_1_20CM_3_71_11]
MNIAVLGAGRIGSTVGRLWHAAGHQVTFAARDLAEPRALAAELGERAHAATVPDSVAVADVVLVAVPGSAVSDVLKNAGSLAGRVVIDAANQMGGHRLTLRQLADAYPGAGWVRAFNTLQARVLAEENHRQPPWVVFLSGTETAKRTATKLIRDAGFEPVDLGGVEDSQLQEPGSVLWNNPLTPNDAHDLVARVRSGDAVTVDPLAEAFDKLRKHAPDDPALLFEHLSRAVFQAGMGWRVVAAKWPGIREAFHRFDPARVASMSPGEIERVEGDTRVIRNRAKIEATVENARRLRALLDEYGGIRPYFGSFPDATAASADLRRRFAFLGESGVHWLLLHAADEAAAGR